MSDNSIRQSKIYDAIDVANHILNHLHGKRRSISNLKLQKILYFIQAQFLITYGEPCFRDPILAWDSGPVVKSVFDEYKIFGAGSIPSITQKPVNTVIQVKDLMLINDVIQMCDKYGSTTLLNFIHGQMPWKQGRNRANNYITNEDLYKFFSE